MGRFETGATDPGDKQVTPLTKGQFIGIYADDRCRIDFEFETRRRIIRLRKVGGIISPTVVDQGADRVTVIFNRGRAQVYEFSGGRRPAIVQPNIVRACMKAGFPFGDPFVLRNAASELGVLFDPRLQKNIVMAADGKKFVGQFAANAQTKWQIVVDPDAGYRVTEYKVFDNNDHPMRDVQLTWKRTSGIWFVSHIKKINELHGMAGEMLLESSECMILNFRTNVKVDPDLIQLSAVDEPLEPALLPENEDDGEE